MAMRLALTKGVPLAMIYSQFTAQQLVELYVFDMLERKADLKMQASFKGVEL